MDEKIFKVTITEILKKTVEVEAFDLCDAEAMVEHAWNDAQYILDADHFVEARFDAGEVIGSVTYQRYQTLCGLYPDSLVLVRNPKDLSYFEALGNMAKEAAEDISCVIGMREIHADDDLTQKLPLLRIYADSFDSYLEKLTEKGYKIAVVYQYGSDECGQKDANVVVYPINSSCTGLPETGVK